MTIRPHPAEFLYAERGAASPERRAAMLDAFLTGYGNPSREVDGLLAENPRSPFGHCLRIALAVRADNIDARSRILESIAAIETICPEADHFARRHARAARAWLDGDQALSLERYGAIVVGFPRDIVARAVAHALDFRLGLRRILRDRIAQVISDWHDEMPGYAGVLAIYASGLEEDGQYRRAEKMARRALELNPQHPRAMHVVAHVTQMQRRSRQGACDARPTGKGRMAGL
jgi:hypothetical protein